jgi:hypothetical protein
MVFFELRKCAAKVASPAANCQPSARDFAQRFHNAPTSRITRCISLNWLSNKRLSSKRSNL